MNYYEILQVTNSAEAEVIDAAYKRLSLKYHPDKNAETNANERMQQINEAYEVIGKSESRAEYDLFLLRQYKNENGLEIQERIFQLISIITNIPIRKIDLTDRISEDLNFTDETFPKFLMILQEEFQITISEDGGGEAILNATVGELIQGTREILSVDTNNLPANVTDQMTVKETQKKSPPNEDFFSSLINIAGEVMKQANTAFADTCPNCGDRSWVHQEKQSKSVWDYLSGQQRIHCRNCGRTFTV